MRKGAKARSFAIIAMLAMVSTLAMVTQVPASSNQNTYIVLYQRNDVPDNAGRAIVSAGGTLVASYDEIGVAVARSSNDSFAQTLGRDSRVEGVSSTTAFGVQISDELDDAEGPPPGNLANAPASDSDTFSNLQWDMRQIRAPEAHAITGGSPAVVVGNIDTGIDKDHPDLQANIDFSKSVSCESGAPDPNPNAWDDRNGHGTHTAGTIAAASNGFGIVGTAPNVKLAGIKASTDEGFFFPEMVVCAFMWAGHQRLDVTNNSYFADPFLYNCRNDPAQRAIWKAEQRAIRFAMQRGVTVVSSAGNDSTDRSHPETDTTSPDFPPGSEVERQVTNACVVVPLEIPGVIGVSAAGNTQQNDGDTDPDYLKSFYSSYGVSTVELVAPGGDSIFGLTTESPNGRVLSTYPAEQFCQPSRRLVDASVPGAAYCYLQGTSMAAPHVSGAAALIISLFGDNSTPQNGKMRSEQVAAFLQQTARSQLCPSELPPGYAAFTQEHGEPQTCQGGEGHNSWYGYGHLDVLNALTRASGNR